MEALKRLEQELLCAICLDIFTDPKLLNCGHVFCATCLPKLVYPEDSLPCPTCRKVTPYPESGAKGLQTAFRVNSLLEIQQSLKSNLSKGSQENAEDSLSTTSSTLSTNSSLPPLFCCSEHPNQELKLFCEQCGKLVCIECAVDGSEHYTHKPVLLEKTSSRLKDKIRTSLEPAKKQMARINSSLSKVNTACQEISQQQENIEEKIRNTARQLCRAIEARTADLISQLHQLTQTKLKTLYSQRDAIETALMKYQQCEATVEEKLQTGSDVEIVTTKESIMEKVEALTSSFQPEILKPSAFANLEFTSGDATAFCLEYGSLCEAAAPPDPSQCFILDLGSLEVGKQSSLLVRTMDSNGQLYERDIQLLECELVSELNGTKSAFSCERKEKSLYKLNFTPTVRGNHQLFVTINGQHITGSPVALPVHQSIEQVSTPISTITDVVKPWGVAINQRGEIVVSEKAKHRVSVFSPRGEKLLSFGTEGSKEGQFKKPCGIAVDQTGNILVADTKNYRIQKFTSNGEFLSAVGTKGSGELQFKKLRGLVFNSFNSWVYVIDGDNIKILNSDLTFISSIGKFGPKNITFSMPVSIACDCYGKLYVADCMNNRIVILTPEGGFLKSYGKFHVTKQTFNHPVGVAVDNDELIYLSQLINGHNRVSVVTSEGELVKVLDGGSGIEWGTIYTPIGLAVDPSGVLYVCELNSDRVVLY